jgi:hypothetical protein
VQQAGEIATVGGVSQETDVDAEPSGFQRSADPVDAPGEAAQRGQQRDQLIGRLVRPLAKGRCCVTAHAAAQHRVWSGGELPAGAWRESFPDLVVGALNVAEERIATG